MREKLRKIPEAICHGVFASLFLRTSSSSYASHARHLKDRERYNNGEQKIGLPIDKKKDEREGEQRVKETRLMTARKGSSERVEETQER